MKKNRAKFKLTILTTLVAAVCIVAFGYSAVYFQRTTVPMIHADPISPYDYLVLYTKDGFSTTTLEVPLGSKVAFENKSDIPLWVGSDPHPTHTDYPAFDAKKSYAPGETYIFTFDHSGTFGYHNHLNSLHRGIIHVYDPNHEDHDISKTIENQRATRDKLLALLDPQDSNSIFKVIDTIEANPTISLNCHDIAHDLGHRSYELYGFSGAMTLQSPYRLSHASVQDICAGGYVHGILEELSLHQPDFVTDPGRMCVDIPKDSQDTCFHGVGHALMFTYNRDISTSLEGCRLMDTANHKTRCFEGVWMELFWGNKDHSTQKTLGWDTENPLGPCIATDKDAKPACFLYSAFGYLRTHQKDYSGAIKMCNSPETSLDDAGFCMKGVGITMMSNFKAQHLEQSEAYVAGFSHFEKTAFYQGVIGYAAFSGIKKSELEATCNIMKNDKDVCLEVLAQI